MKFVFRVTRFFMKLFMINGLAFSAYAAFTYYKFKSEGIHTNTTAEAFDMDSADNASTFSGDGRNILGAHRSRVFPNETRN